MLATSKLYGLLFGLIILKRKFMKTFTYFSVADKEHARMASTMVASARAVGVKEDL